MRRNMEQVRRVFSRSILVIVALLAGAVVPGLARGQADAYPNRPVRLVVPFPPGGSVDLNARLLSGKLSELLGQQVIVDNRGGASGMIGSEAVARSAPDGYTLVLTSVPFVTSTVLYSKPLYDPLNDFAPISLLSNVPTSVAVHPSMPARSVKELLALARSKPGALNYASSGIGSNSNITGELFNLMGKVNIVAIQFKGGGPALLAAVSGEAPISFSNVSETARMVEAKRLVALGVSSLKRSPILPNVPTISEAGLPGFEFQAWHGVLAPKGTPPKLVAFLNEKVRSAMAAPDQMKRFQERGMEVITSSPEEYAAYLKSEVAKWGKVVRERNMKAE
jgi:tripartite-type tricarboxylate transporter receptor subunit TctC